MRPGPPAPAPAPPAPPDSRRRARAAGEQLPGGSRVLAAAAGDARGAGRYADLGQPHDRQRRPGRRRRPAVRPGARVGDLTAARPPALPSATRRSMRAASPIGPACGRARSSSCAQGLTWSIDQAAVGAAGCVRAGAPHTEGDARARQERAEKAIEGSRGERWNKTFYMPSQADRCGLAGPDLCDPMIPFTCPCRPTGAGLLALPLCAVCVLRPDTLQTPYGQRCAAMPH